MFDTFQGLPVHALIVHATVVLLPLMCLVTVLVAVRPRLRARYAWWTFAADVALVALCYATTQSGSRLEDRLGPNPAIEKHADLGRQLIWFVLALAVAALVVALVKDRGGSFAAGASVATTVAAVLLLVWTFRVGHAGAEAVWSGLPSKKS
jgi:bacteriorhodopsin